MLDRSHSAAIEAILFGSAEVPAWLSDSVRACASRYRGLALTEEFQSAINAFDDERGERKPFELFVVGEGKFGKSTLVNCLLGERLSRVRVLPETRCFLRYVLKDETTPIARVFVRLKEGMHDWLKGHLGQGTKAKDLYEVTEHKVPLKHVGRILQEEIARLDAGGYTAAIVEVERDVKRSVHSAFEHDLRIVDTQGIDQLFPDEVKKRAEALSESSGRELFLDWMSKTPRGKYLEWQFRRCDCVLWCINAKRIGSASTAAALRYFSEYSKKVVVALTSVDLVARKDGDMERLVERAEELYGNFVAEICPVNGQGAWEAMEAGDRDRLSTSGFPDLVRTIQFVCTNQGNKVRNLARYFAIRRTERQYRASLRTLHETYGRLHARYKRDRQGIEASREDAKAIVTSAVGDAFTEIAKEVVERVGQVSLSDDRYDAEQKVGFTAAGKAASGFIQELISHGVIPDLVKAGEEIAPYNLPTFDADGRVAGSRIRVDFEPPRTQWVDPDVHFVFSLESSWLKDKGLKLLEFFGSRKARHERLELERSRRNELASLFLEHWSIYLDSSAEAVRVEIDRLYETPLYELDRVLARLEKEAGYPLLVAADKIESSLAAFAVMPAISSGIMRAVENARR